MSWAPYIHPSGQYMLFASNKLGFENFEVFMVDIDGTKEPVRITYADGFDGLPVPSPDGRRARLDVESRRRPRRTDLSRGVESRSGAGRAEGGTRQTPVILHGAASRGRRHSMNCMTTIMRPLFVAVLGLVLATPASHAQTAAPSATKAHVEFLASDKLEGREAGSSGERLAAEYLDGAALADRRPAAAWPLRHVHALRVHRGQPRRWFA